jgi:predicted DNA binding CopG/RHH family protein
MRVSKEEKELLDSVERDEWVSIPDFRKERQRYQEYARATFRKDKRVNIRISEKDLKRIQRRALQEGLSYQTLIASILHKFVMEQLEKKAP